MSLVLGILTQDNRMILAADKRAIKNGIVNDDFTKIFRLRDDLYFGMTGIAEYGLVVKSKLELHLNMTVKEIIDFADSIYTPNLFDSAIMICGRLQNHVGFIWTKNTENDCTYIETLEGDTQYSILTATNSNLIASRFVKELKLSNFNCNLAINNTFKYASQIDDSISSIYEVFST